MTASTSKKSFGGPKPVPKSWTRRKVIRPCASKRSGVLDSQPGKGFGFQLRNDQNQPAREGMLQLLRDAFAGNEPVTIDFLRSTGKNNGTIIRVALIKQAVV